MRTARFGSLLLLLLVGLTAAPPDGLASTYSEIVVIGDSLSDVGNINELAMSVLGTPVPPPTYFEGRFSNGPVWIEHVAEGLGLDASVPFLKDGRAKNFAVGGAQVGFANGAVRDAIEPVLGPTLAGALSNFGMSTQILTHLVEGGAVDGKELYVVWGGGNDFLQNQATVDTTALALTQAFNLFLLEFGGASEVLVPNLPPLGRIPRLLGTPSADEIDRLVRQYNDQLEIVRQGVELLTDLTLIPFDMHQLFSDAIEVAPEWFNVSEPALQGGVLVGDPDLFFYWDDVHPTAIVHQLLAHEVLEALLRRPSPQLAARNARSEDLPLDALALEELLRSPRRQSDELAWAGAMLGGPEARWDLKTALPLLMGLREAAAVTIAAHGVPEPAGATLLLIAAAWLWGARGVRRAA